MSEPQFTILVDRDCPLCRREAALLERLDAGRGRLALVDISAPHFDAGAYGRPLDALMARIHGVLPDGELVEGVEVFRRAYAAVGRGWWLGWTRWPGLRSVADAGYRWFARNRLRWTGREDACSAETCRPAVAGSATPDEAAGSRAPQDRPATTAASGERATTTGRAAG